MKSIELQQLFAVPLQSAIRAQGQAVVESIAVIEQLALDNGVAKTFPITIERMVEEKTSDGSKSQIRIERVPMSVPLLALMNPPTIDLQEMNVEFGVEVVDPNDEAIVTKSLKGITNATSMARTRAVFTPLGQSNPTTMKVNMKIVRQVPEGLARLSDMLADAVVVQKAVKPPDPIVPILPHPPVDRIPGIGPEFGGVLRGKGIATIQDFLAATSTEDKIKAMAKELKVSDKRVREWIDLGKSYKE